MADLQWRIGGCFYLEAEILRSAGPSFETAFLRDIQGGELLSRLARCESKLLRDFSRGRRTIQLAAKNRKMAEARMAATEARMAASLAIRKPCTSVIQ
jgi:hypothetical protein